MTKTELRQQIKKLNNEHTLTEEKDLCYGIFDGFSAIKEFVNADFVFSFCSSIHEPDTDDFNLQTLLSGKSLYIPKTAADSCEMDFYRLNNDSDFFSQIETGRFNIREPLIENKNKFDFDNNLENKKIFVLVPGLAFDGNKNRLGHGKGFYDIYLSRLKTACDKKNCRLFLCGICFSWQLCENVPVASEDVKMDLVLSL